MTVETLEDAVKACEISLEEFHKKPVVVNFGRDISVDELLLQLPKLQAAKVVHMLRKKHILVLTMVERNGEKILVRIPSGS